jgi:hypothetical protein
MFPLQPHACDLSIHLYMTHTLLAHPYRKLDHVPGTPAACRFPPSSSTRLLTAQQQLQRRAGSQPGDQLNKQAVATEQQGSSAGLHRSNEF